MATEKVKEKSYKVIPIYKATGALIKLSDLGSIETEFVDEAITRYSYSFYEEKNCAKCDQLESRHSEICDNCASFKGIRQLAKSVLIKDERYLQLPLGNKEKIVRLLRAFKLKGKTVVKHRKTQDFSRPIKFVRKLYPYQDEAEEAAFNAQRGIIEAPPRSGKTIIATSLICRVGKKALILAHQREWLDQFRKSFLEDEGGSPFTNAKKTQVRMCKTVEDFKKTDVCLATFQQFFNENGKNTLKKIKGMFEIVVSDEVHQTAALETSRVLAQFNSRYMIGLSGTPERKLVTENVIFNLLVGPVIYKAKVDRLKPLLVPLPTGVSLDPSNSSQGAFTRFYASLEQNKERTKVIVNAIMKAVEDGHSVMLPLSRTKSVDLFVKKINEAADAKIAVPFTGQLKKFNRDKNLAAVKSGEAKVIVGSIGLLSTGLNIPILSCLIERATVTSNKPKCQQRVSRILTPMPGKLNPLIIYLMDESKLMRSTAKNEFWNALKPGVDPVIEPKEYSKLLDWFKGGGGFGTTTYGESLRGGV